MDKRLSNLIKGLEIELLQPDVRKSIGRLDELLADDFVEFASIGVQYNKKDILDHLPKSSETKWITHDFKTKELSSDTILATYRVEKHVIASGEKSWSLRSSLWQKQNGQWKMIFHQGTLQHV